MQSYAFYIHEVAFMFNMLLPKKGECGVSLEARLNITLSIKVPARILLAKRLYYISIPLKNVLIQYYSFLFFYYYWDTTYEAFFVNVFTDTLDK